MIIMTILTDNNDDDNNNDEDNCDIHSTYIEVGGAAPTLLVQDVRGLGAGPTRPVPEGAATAAHPPVAFSPFRNLAGIALLTVLALSLALVASLLAPPTWDADSPGPISSVIDDVAKGGTDRMLAICSLKAWLTSKIVLLSMCTSLTSFSPQLFSNFQPSDTTNL